MEFFEHKHHKPVEPLPEYKPIPPFHDHPCPEYKPIPPFHDHHCDGYDIPVMRPCKPYVHGLSPEEQMCILTGKVNELICNYNENTEKVYGAYHAIVESALCNDAYYNEVTVEEGYIAEASAPYKVIHIPFLDRAKQPIFIELGLAYNNTTNANVHENVFSASERTLADKLIPAYQSTNTWHGAVVWKGAPISNIGENPADYTVGITENGFIKVYEHLMNYGQLQQDRVRNAMLANSILVQGGKMTPDKFFPDEKDQLIGRVGIGMNYDTKERFMVIVNGSDTWGCTTEMLANIFLKYNCTVAVEVANGMKTTALDKGALLFTPPTVAGDEVPTIPEVNAFWYITKRRHYHNEYVKDVASLTQKYGQMLWRCETANISVDNIKEEVANLSQKLDTEIADREEGDNNLQEQITQEVANREQGDKTLNDRITQEVQTLNDRIDTEVETLNELISDTKKELQTNIDNLDAKVEQYHTELNNADIASVDILQDGTKDTYRLKRKDGTYVDIPMEVYNYELLLQKLDTLAALEPRLEQEIQARKDGDTNLQNQINDLTDDMTEKDNQLLESINEETQNRVEAIQAEEQARQQGDNTLQQNINNEAASRQEGDTALQQKIDELTGEMGSDYVKKAGDIMTGALTLPGDPVNNLEASTKQYVDNTVTQTIAAEAAEREKQDDLLQDAINQEATTREQADTALDNRVEAVEQAMTQFDNKVIVVGDTTLIGEGVTAIGQGKVVLWVRENKDAVVLTAYDADAVMFKGYTMEQPAFVTYTYANTGVAFSTGTEAFLSPVVGTPTDENQAVSQSYVTNLIEQGGNVVFMNIETVTFAEIKNSSDNGKLVILYSITDSSKIMYIVITVSADETSCVISTITGGDNTYNLTTWAGQLSNKLIDTSVKSKFLGIAASGDGSAVRLLTDNDKDIRIIRVGTPVGATDVPNKKYVDDLFDSAGEGDFKADGSVTATGDFNMGGHAITNVEAPTNENDVANKGYVDSIAGGNVTVFDHDTVTMGDLYRASFENKVVFIKYPTATGIRTYYDMRRVIEMQALSNPDSSRSFSVTVTYTGGFIRKGVGVYHDESELDRILYSDEDLIYDEYGVIETGGLPNLILTTPSAIDSGYYIGGIGTFKTLPGEYTGSNTRNCIPSREYVDRVATDTSLEITGPIATQGIILYSGVTQNSFDIRFYYNKTVQGNVDLTCANAISAGTAIIRFQNRKIDGSFIFIDTNTYEMIYGDCVVTGEDTDIILRSNVTAGRNLKGSIISGTTDVIYTE